MRSAKKMPPFLMLYDNDYDKRKCLLSQWMNSNCFEEIVDGMWSNSVDLQFWVALICIENCDVYDTSSILSSSDEVQCMSAILPAVYLLKHLLFKPPSDMHVLASRLLEYTQRLSCVTVRELKPLLDLASQKVKITISLHLDWCYSINIQSAADSKCVSLLNCVNSAYGLLVNIHLTDSVNTVRHSLSEVGCYAVQWVILRGANFRE